MMRKLNKAEFLVFGVKTDHHHSSPIISLYFPDVAKKVEQYSYDLFVQKCKITKRKIIYFQDQDVKKYFQDYQKLKIKFHNIKDYFLINKYFKFASKNNLCLGLGINHNFGLEQDWQVFEKINGEYCYCENKDDGHGNGLCTLYSLTDQYYFSVSRINSYLNIDRVVNIPRFEIAFEEVFRFLLPPNLLLNFQPQKNFAKDDGNIFEKMITESLNAIKDEKGKFFAINNKKKLIKLGSFKYEAIKEDRKYQAEVEKVAVAIKSEINKLITFIKEEIFKSQQIKTQELVVNDQLKIFGYTDFSNNHAVLEMKFVQDCSKINDLNEINNYINRYRYQLYLNTKERPTYLLIGSYEKFLIFRIKFKK